MAVCFCLFYHLIRGGLSWHIYVTVWDKRHANARNGTSASIVWCGITVAYTGDYAVITETLDYYADCAWPFRYGLTSID